MNWALEYCSQVLFFPVEISPPRFADDLNLADLNNDGADIIDSSGLISLADGTGGFNEPFSTIMLEMRERLWPLQILIMIIIRISF